jgi:hypothetical protein
MLFHNSNVSFKSNKRLVPLFNSWANSNKRESTWVHVIKLKLKPLIFTIQIKYSHTIGPHTQAHVISMLLYIVTLHQSCIVSMYIIIELNNFNICVIVSSFIAWVVIIHLIFISMVSNEEITFAINIFVFLVNTLQKIHIIPSWESFSHEWQWTFYNNEILTYTFNCLPSHKMHATQWGHKVHGHKTKALG